jgi:large subunit ribosomal protein L3
MTIGLLGKKLGMTRVYDEAGAFIPVTVIQAGPCPILQIKCKEKDGYSALQLGFDPKAERKVTRPLLGHFKRAGVAPVYLVREFRTEDLGEFSLGQALDLKVFDIGEKVDITGISKGRGFAGFQKRHHSSRGPESHGSMYHRRSGSMGASADPSHVFKGKPGAGHMGAARSTVQNLKVVRVDKEKNLLLVRGSIPGNNNGYVIIRKSVKLGQKKKVTAGKI